MCPVARVYQLDPWVPVTSSGWFPFWCRINDVATHIFFWREQRSHWSSLSEQFLVITSNLGYSLEWLLKLTRWMLHTEHKPGKINILHFSICYISVEIIISCLKISPLPIKPFDVCRFYFPWLSLFFSFPQLVFQTLESVCKDWLSAWEERNILSLLQSNQKYSEHQNWALLSRALVTVEITGNASMCVWSTLGGELFLPRNAIESWPAWVTVWNVALK